MERQTHVQTIEPDLVGVDALVPETAAGGARLVAQLFFQRFNGLAVARLAGLVIQGIQRAARRDVVQVVFLGHIAANGTVRLDVSLHKAVQHIKVKRITGRLVQRTQADQHTAILVVPHIPVCLAELLCVGPQVSFV